MLKIASRIDCRVPAARNAAKDDPYSTIRRSPRWRPRDAWGGAVRPRVPAEPASERLVPVLEREAEGDPGRSPQEEGRDDPAANRREHAREEHPEARADADQEPDPVPLAHPGQSRPVVSSNGGGGGRGGGGGTRV